MTCLILDVAGTYTCPHTSEECRRRSWPDCYVSSKPRSGRVASYFGTAPIPPPRKAPKAWSDHSVFWGKCETIDACTSANRCALREARDAATKPLT